MISQKGVGKVSNVFLQGEVEDRLVSFNIERKVFDIERKSRKVITPLKSPFPKKRFYMPGLLEKKERVLFQEIKSYQNINDIRKYSCNYEKHLYSIMWRFGADENSASIMKSTPTPVDKNCRKEIERVNKLHCQDISRGLKPGAVYLLPDREVMFNKIKRDKKPYSRSVLIAAVDSSQLTFIPISSIYNWLNTEIDIVFDKTRTKSHLIRIPGQP